MFSSFKSWWFFLFLATLSLFYLHGMHEKEQEHNELKGRLEILEKGRIAALERQEDLQLQIHSQTDPAWIEMVLKRNLGMVPEGQVKVFFSIP